ncbi:hypothetical protein E4U51_002861 [Claviceps purpurea]|nr:hypothetical protein E4U51_002861 [Claviceps purpurea]
MYSTIEPGGVVVIDVEKNHDFPGVNIPISDLFAHRTIAANAWVMTAAIMICSCLWVLVTSPSRFMSAMLASAAFTILRFSLCGALYSTISRSWDPSSEAKTLHSNIALDPKA